MRLLIICQKVDVNDDLLGFFIDWIREFAKKTEKVYVVCLFKGEPPAGGLPDNVAVFSLGKERGVSRIARWFKFYKILFKLLPKFDLIFSHMCPIYAIAASPVRLLGKKNTLWYAHGSVNPILKLAVIFSDLVFTSSLKGCRVPSKKVKVVGQGINTEVFNIKKVELEFDILTVGRISPSKHIEILIRAVEILNQPDLTIKIIGQEGLPSQKEYFEKLKRLVREKCLEKNIKFLGSVPNKDIARYYQKARLFVNMSTTGSLDKTVLEAMACGIPVLNCNEAYKDVLPKECFYEPGDSEGLAEKIKLFLGAAVRPADYWREIVLRDHSLDKLINKIYETINHHPGL
ncbi:MAG: glycosyltransferase family 4 protein [bacterium]